MNSARAGRREIIRRNLLKGAPQRGVADLKPGKLNGARRAELFGKPGKMILVETDSAIFEIRSRP